MFWAKAVMHEVSEERRQRWKKYFIPYSQLDEKVKDADREWALRVISALDDHFCE